MLYHNRISSLFLIVILVFAVMPVSALSELAAQDADLLDYRDLSVYENGSSNITRSLNLPVIGKQNGSRITWASSDTCHITNEGRVIRPRYDESNAEVTLTATITNGQDIVNKEFQFTVLADTPFTDPQYMTDEEFFGKWSGEEWVVQSKLDYSIEELADVQAAVKVNDYSSAKSALLTYFQNRTPKAEITASMRNYGKANMLSNDIYSLDNGNFYQGEITIGNTVTAVTVSIPVTGISAGLVSFSVRALYNEMSEAKIASSNNLDASLRPQVELVVNGERRVYAAVKDVTIRAGNYMNNNFGSDEYLYAQTFGDFLGDETKYGIITFDFSDLQSSDVITSASLRIHAGITQQGLEEKRLIVLTEKNTTYYEDTADWYSFSGQVYSYNGLPGKNTWQKVTNNDGEYLWQVSRLNGLKNMAAEAMYSNDLWYLYQGQRIIEDLILDTGNTLASSTGTAQTGNLRGGFPRSLDCAVRNDSYGQCFDAIIRSPYATAEFCTAWLKTIWDTANFLKHYQTSEGNWRQHEMMSLFNMGIYFPEFYDNFNGAMWNEFAEDLLMDVIFLNTMNDGTYIEASGGYSIAAFSDFSLLKSKLLTIGSETDSDYNKRLRYNAYYNALLYAPDGSYIMYGDGMPATINPGTFAGVVNWFGDSELEYITTLGAQGTVPVWTSRTFPTSKTTIMRANWTKNSPYIFTNVRGGGGHGHSDDNGIIAYAYGRILLTDAGTFEYDGNDPLRQWGISSVAHNTVVINDLNQKNDGTIGSVHKFSTNGAFDYLSQSTLQTEGFEHERNITFLKSGMWIVSDRMIPEDVQAENSYKQMWHMLPEADIAIDSGNNLISNYTEGANIIISCVDAEDVSLDEGWYDRGYNQVVSNPYGYFEKKNLVGTQRFNTVLLPVQDGEEAAVDTQKIETSNDSDAMKITIQRAGETLTGYYYKSYDGLSGIFGDYTTDADMVYIEYNSDGNLRQLVLANGKYIKKSDVYLLNSEETITDISVEYGDAVANICTEKAQELGNFCLSVMPNITQYSLNGKEVEDNVVDSYVEIDTGKLQYLAHYYDEASVIVVMGQLNESRTSDLVSLILVPKEVDSMILTLSDIAYMDETTVDKDGNYRFVFQFNGNIEDYAVRLNQDGQNVTASIINCDIVGKVIDMTATTFEEEGRTYLKGQIENLYLSDLEYIVLVAFYGAQNELISCMIGNTKSTNDRYITEILEIDAPPNFTNMRIYVWNNLKDLKPLL